ADGRRGGYQPSAARRPHGLRPLARRHLDRTAAGRRPPGAGRALGLHAERRKLVRVGSARRLPQGVALVAVLVALGGCAMVTETNPARTATDMLLVNRAADRAVEGLTLPIPQGARVFVDE